MKAPIICAALALAGCHPAIIAAPIVAAPVIATQLGWIGSTVTVLTESAKLACAVQAIANDLNRPNVSAVAGALCKW